MSTQFNPPFALQLTADESKLTQDLKSKIIAQIAAHGGCIPVSKYIELALYDHCYGYYNNLLHKFGVDGDFITAPILSELFALCLARQIRELWHNSEVPPNVLEIGAGNGQLMFDLLTNLGDLIGHYYILELSASLASFQQQELSTKYPQFLSKVTWLNALPDNFDGIILANEVLDAQPCEVVVWSEGNTEQRMVGVDKDGDLIYLTKPICSDELNQIASLIRMSTKSSSIGIDVNIDIDKNPYISEINLNNRGFMKSLAGALRHGFILLIDYGYCASEYYLPNRSNGTLRGYFRHRQLDDILSYPGLIDITSSIDFSAIALTAIDNQLDFIGYTTQANFLLNCGLADIVASQHGNIDDIKYLKLTNQVNYLTAPDEMGEVFKIIGFSKDIDFNDWMGFKRNDLSHTL
ncbi:MAG: Class SAM-dependent methyltransferase [Pseudomonadota bacterium]|nr:Class SAM-dependent methyltransferase [Pseudomonadota bacterium]